MKKPLPSTLWISAVYSSGLSSNDKLVASYLAHCMYGQKLTAYPSVMTIARETSLSESSVRRSIRSLKDAGWIEAISQKNAGNIEYMGLTPVSVTPPVRETPLSERQAPPVTQTPEVTREVTSNISNKKFTPPSLEELNAYCREKNYTFDTETFMAHYSANGWKVGRNPMKCWKSACTTWQKREKSNGSRAANQQGGRGGSQGVTVRRASDMFDTGHVYDG